MSADTRVEGWYWARGACWLNAPNEWEIVRVCENCGEWVAYQDQARTRLDADPALELIGPIQAPKD